MELDSLLTQELLISLRTSPEVSVLNLGPSSDICDASAHFTEKSAFFTMILKHGALVSFFTIY